MFKLLSVILFLSWAIFGGYWWQQNHLNDCPSKPMADSSAIGPKIDTVKNLSAPLDSSFTDQADTTQITVKDQEQILLEPIELAFDEKTKKMTPTKISESYLTVAKDFLLKQKDKRLLIAGSHAEEIKKELTQQGFAEKSLVVDKNKKTTLGNVEIKLKP